MHIVMEHCDGGTLVDRISDRERYTERAAASVFRSVVNALHACHSNGIMHRDLKPENFIFTTDDENATLKATNFGLAFFFEEGKAALLEYIVYKWSYFCIYFIISKLLLVSC